MSLLNLFRKQRLRFGLLVALLATLAGGVFAAVQAQEPVPTQCRTFDRVRVCGDEVFEDNLGAIISGETLTIGYDNNPPHVQVKPSAGVNGPEQPSFTFDPGPNAFGATYYLFGSIHFIANPKKAESMARSVVVNSTSGVFHVDTIQGQIRNPSTATPIEQERGFLRNELLRLDYLQFAQYDFARDLVLFGGKKEELAKVDMTINLQTGELSSVLQLKTAKVFPASKHFVNPELRVTIRYDRFGEPNGRSGFEGLEVRAGGLHGRLKGARELSSENDRLRSTSRVVTPQDGNQQINFEAEVLEFFRTDNPDLPNLDTSNPDLVFSLQAYSSRTVAFRCAAARWASPTGRSAAP